MLLPRIGAKLFFVVLSFYPLMADNNISADLSPSDPIPDVPEFSITYQGDLLLCSPTGLIKTKTRKDLVTYECRKKYVEKKIEKKEDDERGHAETIRLNRDVKEKMAKGPSYSVEVPLQVADIPVRARIIAENQLNDRPFGKYLHTLLPAKLYLSLRPQFKLSEEDDGMKFQGGHSRAGFFYYYQFHNDLELMFHYEAGIDRDKGAPFLNISDGPNTNRRLSYLALKYMNNSMIVGKYWSAYYDIASFTDQFMVYGAQASGAFSSGQSATGRSDRMVQYRTNEDTYDATLQVQFGHDALRDWNTDYSYTMAGSLVYKGWEDVRLGASVSYGKFDTITPEMQNDGIVGDDLSSIIGVSYKKNSFSANAVLSYMKNHTADEQGVYFDSAGAELYMRYDIDENFRVAGGGNWLFPKDNDYEGKYAIKEIILSLQYTFGEKTFDDLVYIEVSLPNGRLANGDKRGSSVIVGLRYLIDY